MLAEQAWEYHRGEDVAPMSQGESAFTLAKALWQAHRAREQRVRARGLAERAKEAYARAIAGGVVIDESAREVERWLEEHRVE